MSKVIRIDFKKMRDAAAAQRLSTRTIAEQAGGMTHSTVYGVLRGETNPSAINVKRICDVLGLPVGEVFIETKAAA